MYMHCLSLQGRTKISLYDLVFGYWAKTLWSTLNVTPEVSSFLKLFEAKRLIIYHLKVSDMGFLYKKQMKVNYIVHLDNMSMIKLFL